jgi:hypothetical protein
VKSLLQKSGLSSKLQTDTAWAACEVAVKASHADARAGCTDMGTLGRLAQLSDLKAERMALGTVTKQTSASSSSESDSGSASDADVRSLTCRDTALSARRLPSNTAVGS